MTTVLPSSRAQKLQFFKSHISAWKANAVAIGVTPAAMTAFETLINAADTNYQSMQVARDAAKSSTQKFYHAADDMTSPGRDIIATIKAFAESTNNPNVLVLANIPPDAPPTPATAPAAPTNLNGSLSTTGLLTLTWDSLEHGASNGIVFLVNRKNQGQTSFTLVGATFERTFIDASFNAANGSTIYQVQAQRGSLSSAFSNTLSVDLGLGGGGFTSSVAGSVGMNGGVNAAAA